MGGGLVGDVEGEDDSERLTWKVVLLVARSLVSFVGGGVEQVELSGLVVVFLGRCLGTGLMGGV